GVLFLDELPEYRRDVLEALRQPLEDGFVTITRVSAQATYPARFVLICSMNPCPCGHLGSRTQQCRCTPSEIRRYLNRISGPLLDRIDMHIEVESIPADHLADAAESECSASIRARVSAARDVQLKRYESERGNVRCNAQLDARTLAKSCTMTPEARELLLLSSERLRLSNRAYTRILKVARTIADLEGADDIAAEHISEAVQYRTLDRKYWG
ncbi:MAG: ATP-binding protein, partial [Candidatus Faecivicinus sp.]